MSDAIDSPVAGQRGGQADRLLPPLGFLYAALLPELTASDVLRLQYLRDPSALERMASLVFPEAREILAVALAERASV